ncbi:uncharacterized protein TRIADDRAFT_58901 [Trichoplax adhaerens]|uniref:Uncharacterized protein n=1 Tax=Trichoplax adhaerens TaxID=10228 RepID=B3S3Z7_TRIAD|nr:hypothetical protein TRIADDRAFT_58901 [Trichoplax adhaerens]EDV22366.1 hypothetical protein TRIADDRAFT_58901 [Trichoplax adhaerens]|eukprot:XP_002114910.1 hypothetical protein TRIADDRAFT_58901 [Trichoplax adhaerens]
MAPNEYNQMINDKTELLIHFAKAIIDLMNQLTVNSETSCPNNYESNDVIIKKIQQGEYNVTEKDDINDQSGLLIKLITDINHSVHYQNGHANINPSFQANQTEYKDSQHLNHNGSIPSPMATNGRRDSNGNCSDRDIEQQSNNSNKINQDEVLNERTHRHSLSKEPSIDIPNADEHIMRNGHADNAAKTISIADIQEENLNTDGEKDSQNKYYDIATSSGLEKEMCNDSVTIANLSDHKDNVQAPMDLPQDQIIINGNSDSLEIRDFINQDFKENFQKLDDHLNEINILSSSKLDEILNQLRKQWFEVVLADNLQIAMLKQWIEETKISSSKALSVIIDMQDLNGNTLLHHCVHNKEFALAEYLLNTELCQAGLYNQLGYTPIMVAALFDIKNDDERRIIMKMLSHSDVDAKATKTGQTALMLAAAHNKVIFSHLLIQAGADINLQDKDGSTALMTACEHGLKDIVKLLLAQPNINVTTLDYDNYDALSIAMGNNFKDCGILIYSYISKTSKAHS